MTRSPDRRNVLAAIAAVLFVTMGPLATLAMTAPVVAQEPPASPSSTPLKVGVTLHPYYSWARAVAKDTDIEVRSIVPGEVDIGSYQPRPEDVKKLADLDAIVVNGLGHDAFIDAMIEASGNTKIVRIRPSDETATLKGAHGEDVNSHTFISFTNAIQQTYAIARALERMRPALGTKMRANAAEYSRSLRKIKAVGAATLAELPLERVVTVHDGYAYLMQEFGIEVAAVVEPAHGLVPSAAELADVVKLVQKEKLTILFSEESFPPPLLDVLRKDTGADVYVLSHVATGEYEDDKFEVEMKRNLDTMVEAFKKAGARGS